MHVSVHAAGLRRGGRRGRAGRARARDADAGGAARRPARGGIAGRRQPLAFDRERDLGARARRETEITDGPFAVTKEVLAGYYVLECADLDEALEQAARLPMAPWATIEVRPVMPRRRVVGDGAPGRRRAVRRGREQPGVSGPVRGCDRRRVPRRAGDRPGHPDPAGRRLPAGRGRGAGRVRGRRHCSGGATACRPIPARGSRPPPGGGRSIACVATGRCADRAERLAELTRLDDPGRRWTTRARSSTTGCG